MGIFFMAFFLVFQTNAIASLTTVFKGVDIDVMETTETGTVVKFSLSALPGDGTKYYRFDLVPSFGVEGYDPYNNYIVMQDFSESAICEYGITEPGDYIFTFYVSPTQGFQTPLSPIIGGSVSIDNQRKISVNSFSLDIDTAVTAGDTVVFSVDSVSSVESDTLYYRFDLIPNYGKESYDAFNGYTTIQNWSTSNECAHVFDDANDYIVIAYVSDFAGFQPDVTPIFGVSVHVGEAVFFIENQENQFSVFPGETYETKIEKEFDDLSGFTFQLINAPTGMGIDNSGKIVYQVPADSQQATLKPFSVKVTDTATGAEAATINGGAYIMAVEVIASGTIGPAGGTVADEWEDFVVEIPEGGLSEETVVRILRGINVDGNPVVNIDSNKKIEGNINIHFPAPSLIDSGSDRFENGSSVRFESGSILRSASTLFAYRWWGNDLGVYSRVGSYRLTEASDNISFGTWLLMGGYVFKVTTAELWGVEPESSEDFGGREPVLFIHGYTKGDNLGGGDGTWGEFPDLIYEVDHAGTKYLPFEFRWRTNARFQDAADDLRRAVFKIAQKTGKKVHLVAHSFGGILSRTMLQELHSTGFSVDYVASITTIGTPHSGIADSENTEMHGISFPEGQDGFSDAVSFELCSQISCHQMGEANMDSWLFDTSLDVSSEKGEIAAALANTGANRLPSLPFQVLIGLTSTRGDASIVDPGDGLISFEGQRFHPKLRSETALLENRTEYGGTVYGATITENILEFSNSTRPGDNVGPLRDGYKHSKGIFQIQGPKIEPLVECSDVQTCQHESFLKVKQWLETYSSETVNVPLFELNFEIVNAETQMPLEGATLVPYADGSESVYIGDNVSDENGEVTLRIAFAPQTEYTAMVGAGGYHAEVFDKGFRSGATLEATSDQFGRIELEPDQPARGNLEGTVIDAVTGAPIGTAYFAVYDGLRLVREGFTNFEGDYFVSDLVRGTYRFVFEKEGYSPTTTFFNVQPQTSNSGFASLRPILSEGQMSVRLSWDEDPRDLDSHLVKYDSNGEREYHIYYSHKNDSGTGDNLDRDDTTSFGPETTTIQSVDPASRYVFAVYDYAGSGSITGTSNAEVTVDYGGLQQPLTLRAPTSGEGRWWKVFEINNGIVEPCRSSCIYSDDSALRSSGLNDHSPLWLKDMKQDLLPKD